MSEKAPTTEYVEEDEIKMDRSNEEPEIKKIEVAKTTKAFESNKAPRLLENHNQSKTETCSLCETVAVVPTLVIFFPIFISLSTYYDQNSAEPLLSSPDR